MKRLSKKATSLIMALILVFSLSATAFASNTGSSLTRAEVTQEVIKNMGLSAQAEASAKEASAFKDVAESSKYEGVINLAYSRGSSTVSARTPLPLTRRLRSWKPLQWSCAAPAWTRRF